jgi:hypothetical protein
MHKNLLIATLLVGLAGLAFARPPQSGSPVPYTYLQSPSGGTLASCPAPIAGVTALCYVATGLYLSTNGGAYVQLGAASGVTSVNGKQGAVVLSATTTVTAPVLSIDPTGGLSVAAPSATTTLQ